MQAMAIARAAERKRPETGRKAGTGAGVVNAWLLAACVLLPLGMGPSLWTACRGGPAQRPVGVSFGGTVVSAVSLLIAQRPARSSYTDLALVPAVLSPAGVLVFARFVGGEDQTSQPDG
jgi:multisubunit Na+/H+ antiporter MnhF subunit